MIYLEFLVILGFYTVFRICIVKAWNNDKIIKYPSLTETYDRSICDDPSVGQVFLNIPPVKWSGLSSLLPLYQPEVSSQMTSS